MILAFYKVNNSMGYERHTFDDIYDKPERIKEKLSMLNDDELRCYDMNNYGYGAVPSPNIADFVEDYNDGILDDSWWCIEINK